ncbi:MAG: carboxypeptidase regulatory-like domain-containing protein [Chloracidobacterium sp.]|nr:carboxypeptidase regulatory-like domain-containing protein [Chloracidobacterium sp.]
MRSLSVFTTVAQGGLRKRREKRRDFSGSTLLAFGVVCVSAVSLLFFSLNANAQTGVISGHVVNEEGAGMPGVTVYLLPVAADRRQTTGRPQNQTATDEDGYFKFTELAQRVYSVAVSSAKGYVQRPVPISERQDGSYYRVGANVTVTMIKGGAINGRVTNAVGEPLISVQVNAAMVRDAEGNPIHGAGRPRFTDDRGIYRMYGLQPGTYVVYTQNRFSGPLRTPYEFDAPTYHPSSTRETATEVTVTIAGEVSGVDIRYRGDLGRVVSGVVRGAESSSSYSGIGVSLTSATAGVYLNASNTVRRDDGTIGFSINGVPDGEYEITARRGGFNNEEGFISTPRRIAVKGADVDGIELKLLPTGSITGKFAMDAAPAVCESKRKWSWEESLLCLRYESKPAGAATTRGLSVVNGLTEKGEFNVYNLEANRYFFAPRLPNENWYVKAISGPASTPAGARGAARKPAPSDVARNGIALKTGEKASGVTVIIAEGAAGVSGKIAPAAPVGDGSRLPARLRVHMVPAEAAAANDVLRYAEVFARSDGSFSFSNIAPGKYWLIARAIPDDEPIDAASMPVALDANERAKLRKEAEAMKIEVELKPCQRVVDQVVNSRIF